MFSCCNVNRFLCGFPMLGRNCVGEGSKLDSWPASRRATERDAPGVAKAQRQCNEDQQPFSGTQSADLLMRCRRCDFHERPHAEASSGSLKVHIFGTRRICAFAHTTVLLCANGDGHPLHLVLRAHRPDEFCTPIECWIVAVYLDADQLRGHRPRSRQQVRQFLLKQVPSTTAVDKTDRKVG
jgi:hypothetical protein